MKRKSASVGILSLGCPRNLVDSEGIIGRLKNKGHPIVDIAGADIAIINTCAFIEDARKESVEAILDLIDLKKAGRIKKILVYGCLSQRYGKKLLKELPEIDGFIGKLSLAGAALRGRVQPEARFALTARHFAYLKICEGCVNNCSYCVIPAIKGPLQSRDIESLLGKVRAFNRQGLTELNIIGQDITGYGIDLYKGQKLTDLLRKIVGVSGAIRWLRLLYLYPSRVSDELLDLIAAEPKICKYIDLPLQHVNDRILKLMHRQITKSQIKRLIAKIRKKIPEVAIRTSLIVGFPSESRNEFKELLEFVKDTEFERLGAFIYSPEEGTRAFNLKGQIPQRIKVERFGEIMSVQNRISEKVNERFLHKTIDVLIDEKQADTYIGRSQYDAPEVDGLVYVNSLRPLEPGDLVKVRINNTLEYDLQGEAL